MNGKVLIPGYHDSHWLSVYTNRVLVKHDSTLTVSAEEGFNQHPLSESQSQQLIWQTDKCVFFSLDVMCQTGWKLAAILSGSEHHLMEKKKETLNVYYN